MLIVGVPLHQIGGLKDPQVLAAGGSASVGDNAKGR